MSDTLLNMTMAGGTKGNKVLFLMGYIDYQIIAPSVNMVNVQRSTAWIASGSAQTTYLITLKDLLSYFLPSGAMHQPSSASIVSVIAPCIVFFTAFVRAELPASHVLARGCHKRLMASFANHLNLSVLSTVTASHRAEINGIAPRLKLFLASQAGSYSGISCYPLPLTIMRTEMVLGIFLFDYMVGTLEVFAAICTGIGFSFYHCCIMACLIAVHCRRVICLKLFPTLEACLEHN